MKYALRILGILVILFALYIIVGEQLVGSSGDAYVNARLSVLRAPIDGTVELAPLSLGGRLEVGEDMGSVSARAPADVPLAGLLQAAADARSDVAAYQQSENQAAVSPLELARAQRRVEAFDEAIRERRAAMALERVAPMVAPAGGIIWSINATGGEYVPQGGIVASIADCSNLLIHATVDHRIFNALAPGQVAQFRMHDGPTMETTVALLAGTGPRTLWDTFALNPTVRQLEGYAVILTAPGLAADGSCPVGRTGRVVFSRGPLAILGDFVDWLGF